MPVSTVLLFESVMSEKKPRAPRRATEDRGFNWLAREDKIMYRDFHTEECSLRSKAAADREGSIVNTDTLTLIEHKPMDKSSGQKQQLREEYRPCRGFIVHAGALTGRVYNAMILPTSQQRP